MPGVPEEPIVSEAHAVPVVLVVSGVHGIPGQTVIPTVVPLVSSGPGVP